MRTNKLGRNVSPGMFILSRLLIVIVKMIRLLISFINPAYDNSIYRLRLIH